MISTSRQDDKTPHERLHFLACPLELAVNRPIAHSQQAGPHRHTTQTAPPARFRLRPDRMTMGVSGGVRRPRSPTGRADRADRGDRHQTRSDRARGRSDNRARGRSDRARGRSDRARNRSDRARTRSDRARARSDRARARSDKKHAGISDRREFASTERGVAAIAPVGSVGAPPSVW